MSTRRIDRSPHPGKAATPTAWPNAKEQLRIAREVGLKTREESNKLWRPIRDLVLEYREFCRTIPPPGDSRLALHDRIRDLSKALAEAERLLRRRTTYLDYRLGRLLGPRLGMLLSDDAISALAGARAAPYVSIHYGEHLEPDDDDGPDHRISVARYNTAVRREHLQARQRVTSAEACDVLRAFFHSMNQPLRGYLEVVRNDKGGAPGLIFRNTAIRRLAGIYETLFNKRPTTTENGPFMRFCSAILPAIGIETDGLRNAVVRELKKLRD